MPLFVGDYMADTIGLTLSEHGAYLLCIMAYWRKGEALTQKELRAICGKEVDRVCRFFTAENGRWHHSRIDLELAKAFKNKEAAIAKGKKGVEARRQKGLLPKI